MLREPAEPLLSLKADLTSLLIWACLIDGFFSRLSQYL